MKHDIATPRVKQFDAYSAADPLRELLLPRLTAHEMAALRAVHPSLRAVVDEGTDALWRRAARPPLMTMAPSPTLGARGVQAALQRRHMALTNLRAGGAVQRFMTPFDLRKVVTSPDATSLAGIGLDGKLSISCDNGTQVRTFNQIPALSRVAWPSYDALLVFKQEEAWAGVFDLRPRALTALVETLATSEADPAALSPDGNWVAYLNRSGELQTLHLPSGATHRRTGMFLPEDQDQDRPVWLPNSRTLLLISDGVRLFDTGDHLDSGIPLGRTRSFSWSPDGSQVAYHNGHTMALYRPASDQSFVFPDMLPHFSYEITQYFYDAEWSLDGSRLRLAPRQGAEVMMDTATWKPVEPARDVHAWRWEYARSSKSRDSKFKYYRQNTKQIAFGSYSYWQEKCIKTLCLPTLLSSVGDGQTNQPDPVQSFRWCPWRGAEHLLALLTQGGSVLVVDAEQERVLFSAHPTPQAGPVGGTGETGDEMHLRWGDNDRTLLVARAQGTEVFDFTQADPHTAEPPAPAVA